MDQSERHPDTDASTISRVEIVHSCEIHPSAEDARRAFDALLAESSETLIGCSHLLTAATVRDIRQEPVGTFAGEIGPTTLLGTFGDGAVARRSAAGNFGGRSDAPKGSFASADEDVVVVHCHGREQSRVTDHAGLRRVLEPVALDDDALTGLLAELHRGRGMVVYARRQTG